jgi:hypothetical protein
MRVDYNLHDANRIASSERCIDGWQGLSDLPVAVMSYLVVAIAHKSLQSEGRYIIQPNIAREILHDTMFLVAGDLCHMDQLGGSVSVFGLETRQISFRLLR